LQRDSQPKRHIQSVVLFGRVAKSNYTPQMIPLGTPFLRSRRNLSDKLFFGNDVIGVPDEGEVTYDAKLPMDLRFYPWEPGEKIKFETQKPIAMGVDLIRTYASHDDTILDISTGSATYPVAAIRCGRRFIAFERDEKHFLIARDRIAPLVSEDQQDAAE
jgi:DNA modification methylase